MRITGGSISGYQIGLSVVGSVGLFIGLLNMIDLKLRMIMEREIRELIESSEGGKDWLAEKLMDYFEENAVYVVQG